MTDGFDRLSTDEFDRAHKDPTHQLIDVRPIAAYNGWSVKGQDRGGHVPGASTFPHAWTTNLDWVDALEEKSLDRDAPTTVYGDDPERVRDVASKLDRVGFSDVSVYLDFAAEWLPDRKRDLSGLDRYEQLVHPQWLREVLDGGDPEAGPSSETVVCHAHFRNRDDYEQGHIPGAIPLNTTELEAPETWNRRSPAEIEQALERLGVTRDTTVVLYGRYSHPTYEQDSPGQSAGHLAAMRCAAILLYAGIEDVRVLNGGIHAWETAGFELSTETVEPEPVDDIGIDVPGRPDLFVDLEEADRLRSSDDGDLVSVRSKAEFVGERSGYHYIDETGRIPGAVFGNCGSDAYHMENYRNFDYTTREFSQIGENWRQQRLTPDQRVAFYCGTGWRASEAFLNAYWMGWPRVSIYDGGWYEWSQDPSTPNHSPG